MGRPYVKCPYMITLSHALPLDETRSGQSSFLARQAGKGAENLTVGYDGRTRLLQGPEDEAPETFDEPSAEPLRIFQP